MKVGNQFGRILECERVVELQAVGGYRDLSIRLCHQTERDTLDVIFTPRTPRERPGGKPVRGDEEVVSDFWINYYTLLYHVRTA